MVSIIAINPGSTSTKLAICSVSENFRKQVGFDYVELKKYICTGVRDEK